MNTRKDIILFAIRDYANQEGGSFGERLWRSADEITELIEQRLDDDSLGDT